MQARASVLEARESFLDQAQTSSNLWNIFRSNLSGGKMSMPKLGQAGGFILGVEAIFPASRGKMKNRFGR